MSVAIHNPKIIFTYGMSNENIDHGNDGNNGKSISSHAKIHRATQWASGCLFPAGPLTPSSELASKHTTYNYMTHVLI